MFKLFEKKISLICLLIVLIGPYNVLGNCLTAKCYKCVLSNHVGRTYACVIGGISGSNWRRAHDSEENYCKPKQRQFINFTALSKDTDYCQPGAKTDTETPMEKENNTDSAATFSGDALG